ncbi:helix-turn-helix domain-containing protein [Candidatus Jettenia sp. AMX1]
MDLYQRLNEFCIEIPPLRRRKDDIVFLCKRFLDITNKELNKNIRGITKEALGILLEYHWPGNVRELKNVIRRAVLLSGEIIEPKHLVVNILETKQQQYHGEDQTSGIRHQIQAADCAASSHLDINSGKELSLHDTVAKCIEDAEKRLIEEVLKRTKGNKSQAAKILKVDYKTMHYKVKKYGITIQTTPEVNRNAQNLA